MFLEEVYIYKVVLVVRAATPSLGKEEGTLVRSYRVTSSPAWPLRFEPKLEGRCSHYDNALI